MKRFLVMLSLVVASIIFIPNVYADRYYNITVEESEWQTSQDGQVVENATYYVDKTIGGYVYFEIIEDKNVKVDPNPNNIVTGPNFDKISAQKTDNGMLVLFKAKDGVTINSKTEVFTILVSIVDPSIKECKLNFSPYGLSCAQIEGHYFDANGNEVTAEQQAASCEGYVAEEPDVPNSPQTGSVIPYIAIGGGLAAIALVYLYSRRSNKVYKI